VIQGCVHDSLWQSGFCATESYIHSAWGVYRKNIDVYIAPSQFMKRKMTEFGLSGDRIVHVPNPLNLEDYAPGDRVSRRFSKRWRVAGSRPSSS
jgi:glycosyltransferase involved in cell wall biosynthesis